jgi:hypothetical protein
MIRTIVTPPDQLRAVSVGEADPRVRATWRVLLAWLRGGRSKCHSESRLRSGIAANDRERFRKFCPTQPLYYAVGFW